MDNIFVRIVLWLFSLLIIFAAIGSVLGGSPNLPAIAAAVVAVVYLISDAVSKKQEKSSGWI
jgi:uncharacterized RDD family membrane protein YckC